MWIKTTDGFINSRDVLHAEFLKDVVSVFPVQCAEWRGLGYPHTIVDADARALMRKAVTDWCDVGDDHYINIERCSSIRLTANGEVELVLPDAKMPNDKSTVYCLSGSQAQRIRAYLNV